MSLESRWSNNNSESSIPPSPKARSKVVKQFTRQPSRPAISVDEDTYISEDESHDSIKARRRELARRMREQAKDSKDAQAKAINVAESSKQSIAAEEAAWIDTEEASEIAAQALAEFAGIMQVEEEEAAAKKREEEAAVAEFARIMQVEEEVAKKKEEEVATKKREEEAAAKKEEEKAAKKREADEATKREAAKAKEVAAKAEPTKKRAAEEAATLEEQEEEVHDQSSPRLLRRNRRPATNRHTSSPPAKKTAQSRAAPAKKTKGKLPPQPPTQTVPAVRRPRIHFEPKEPQVATSVTLAPVRHLPRQGKVPRVADEPQALNSLMLLKQKMAIVIDMLHKQQSAIADLKTRLKTVTRCQKKIIRNQCHMLSRIFDDQELSEPRSRYDSDGSTPISSLIPTGSTRGDVPNEQEGPTTNPSACQDHMIEEARLEDIRLEEQEFCELAAREQDLLQANKSVDNILTDIEKDITPELYAGVEFSTGPNTQHQQQQHTQPDADTIHVQPTPAHHSGTQASNGTCHSIEEDGLSQPMQAGEVSQQLRDAGLPLRGNIQENPVVPAPNIIPDKVAHKAYVSEERMPAVSRFVLDQLHVRPAPVTNFHGGGKFQSEASVRRKMGQ